MALGVISIIIGIVIFGINFFTGTNSAVQQTVQYLGFVCASIFVVGGFIIITVKKCFENNDYLISKIDLKIKE